MTPALQAEILGSIAAGRLVLVIGAGLSMAPPSNAPSANALLTRCIHLYNYFTGDTVPLAAQRSLEELAEFFIARGSFSSLFVGKMLRTIKEFYVAPNLGHEAVSDFLECGAVECCISTNLDMLVEGAAASQGDPSFFSAIDGNEANVAQAHKPFLKVHGCFNRSPLDTLWAHSQLTANPSLQDRITKSSAWLQGVLRERDVIFVGFWSDWGYLNDVISSALNDSVPNKVYLVDPADGASLSAKAPDLWAWATKHNLQHIQESGSDFLDDLRVAYSKNFFSRLLHDAKETFEERFGTLPPGTSTLFDTITSENLYRLRKDVCGVSQDEVVRKKYPDETMHLLGTIIIRAFEVGARIDGYMYDIKGKKVRIVNGGGRLLSKVMDAHSREVVSPVDNVDVVLSTAYDDGGVPRNLVRPHGATGIVRPGVPELWLPLQDTLAFLR